MNIFPWVLADHVSIIIHIDAAFERTCPHDFLTTVQAELPLNHNEALKHNRFPGF